MPHLWNPQKIFDLDRDPRLVSVYDHHTGKHLRDELPADQPFENYRKNEPVKQAWIDRGPELEPEGGGPDAGFNDEF